MGQQKLRYTFVDYLACASIPGGQGDAVSNVSLTFFFVSKSTCVFDNSFNKSRQIKHKKYTTFYCFTLFSMRSERISTFDIYRHCKFVARCNSFFTRLFFTLLASDAKFVSSTINFRLTPLLPGLALK